MIKKYYPLLLIIGYIIAIVTTALFATENLTMALWMQYFMAGFFFLFSLFKLLDLPGFVSSYQMYDIIAKRSRVYAYCYPFLELILGLLYLSGTALFVTNIATIILMGVSTIGVVRAVRSDTDINCACLGSTINLPMTTVTIVEDTMMVGMAAILLVLL